MNIRLINAVSTITDLVQRLSVGGGIDIRVLGIDINSNLTFPVDRRDETTDAAVITLRVGVKPEKSVHGIAPHEGGA